MIKKTLWLTIFFAFLAWSGIQSKDYFTWFLEVVPAPIGLMILAATYRRFCFTDLTYTLILLHCVVLMIGGHYTYAEVPFFDTLAGVFDWQRNNYDKVGHFMQGFVPAAIARELLVRLNVVNGAAWRNTFVLAFCLAFSAFYELIEWWVAISTGDGAEAFLGTQGYVWDTQSDMLCAFIGAVVFIVGFSRWQQRFIDALHR